MKKKGKQLHIIPNPYKHRSPPWSVHHRGENITPTYPRYRRKYIRSVGKMLATKPEATSEALVSRPVRRSCPSALEYHWSHLSAPSTSPFPLATARGTVNGCPRLREPGRCAPFEYFGSPRILGRKGEDGRRHWRMRLPWFPIGHTRTNELARHVW